MKFCVYTRSFYENPYLDYFIEHYCKLGFHKIVILKADTELYSCPPELASFVEIYQVPNKGNDLLPLYDKLVLQKDYDWILSCDVDELLLLNKKYKSIQDFVASKLKNNPKVNTFYFRWGMLEKYDNENINTLPSLLSKYKIYKNIHIKSMVKRTSVQKIHDPHFCKVNDLRIYFEKETQNKNNPLQPLQTESYCDSLLLHFHTRSLHNIVLKALHTAFEPKVVKNFSKFIEIIKSKDEKESLNLFKEAIGKKATLPFTHCKEEVIKTELLNSFTIPLPQKPVIQRHMELADTIKTLEKKKINCLEYLGFISRLNENTKNLFTK